jgi:hypothetical protein
LGGVNLEKISFMSWNHSLLLRCRNGRLTVKQIGTINTHYSLISRVNELPAKMTFAQHYAGPQHAESIWTAGFA